MNRGFLAIFIGFLVLSLVVATGWNLHLDLRTRQTLRRLVNDLTAIANSPAENESLQSLRTRFRQRAIPPSFYRFELSGHPVSDRSALLARAEARLKRRIASMDALFDALRLPSGSGHVQDLHLVKIQARTAAYVRLILSGGKDQQRTVRFLLVRHSDPALRGTSKSRCWYPHALLSREDSVLDAIQQAALEQSRAIGGNDIRKEACIAALLAPFDAPLPNKPLPAVAPRAELDGKLQRLAEKFDTALAKKRDRVLRLLRDKAGPDPAAQRALVTATVDTDGPVGELYRLYQTKLDLEARFMSLPGRLLKLTPDDVRQRKANTAWTELTTDLTAFAKTMDAADVETSCRHIGTLQAEIIEKEHPLQAFNRLVDIHNKAAAMKKELTALQEKAVLEKNPSGVTLAEKRRTYEALRQRLEEARKEYLALLSREDRDDYAAELAPIMFKRDVRRECLEAFFTALTEPRQVHAVQRAGTPGFLLAVSGSAGKGFGIFAPAKTKDAPPRLADAVDRPADYLQSFDDISDQLRSLYNRQRQYEENPDAAEENTLKETVRALTPFFGRALKPTPAAAPPTDVPAKKKDPVTGFLTWLDLDAATPPPATTSDPAAKPRYGLDDLLDHLRHDTISASTWDQRRKNAAAAFARLVVLSYSVDEHVAALQKRLEESEAGQSLVPNIAPDLDAVVRLAHRIRRAADSKNTLSTKPAKAPRKTANDTKPDHGKPPNLEEDKHRYRQHLDAVRDVLQKQLAKTDVRRDCERHLDALVQMAWIDCRRPELRASSLYVLKKTWRWARKAAPEQGYDRVGVMLKVRFKGLATVLLKRTETETYTYEKDIAYQDWIITLIAHEKNVGPSGEMRERRFVPVHFQPADAPLDRQGLETEINHELQRRNHPNGNDNAS